MLDQFSYIKIYGFGSEPVTFNKNFGFIPTDTGRRADWIGINNSSHLNPDLPENSDQQN